NTGGAGEASAVSATERVPAGGIIGHSEGGCARNFGDQSRPAESGARGGDGRGSVLPAWGGAAWPARVAGAGRRYRNASEALPGEVHAAIRPGDTGVFARRYGAAAGA